MSQQTPCDFRRGRSTRHGHGDFPTLEGGKDAGDVVVEAKTSPIGVKDGHAVISAWLYGAGNVRVGPEGPECVVCIKYYEFR